MIGTEHWIIESMILLLGMWAVWKSLPRDPNIPWVQFQEDLRQSLQGSIPSEPRFPKPFTLLEWADISSDSEPLRDYLSKRLQNWIVIGEDALTIGFNKGILMKSAVCDWQEPDKLLSLLEEQIQDRSQRFVFIAKGSQTKDLLRFLHANPAVRDFTGAAVLLEPELQTEWMQEHFNNKEMDVEANISVPYFVCQPEGEAFHLIPQKDESGWKAIEVIQCDPVVLQWFHEQNVMWVQMLAMLMVKRKESV